MTETTCQRCGVEIDLQQEKSWFYQWEEQPSREMIDEAIETDFRDWFTENHIFCPHCHREIQQFIQDKQ